MILQYCRLLTIKNNFKLNFLRFLFRSCFYKHSTKDLQISWCHEKMAKNRNSLKHFPKGSMMVYECANFGGYRTFFIKGYYRGCKFAPPPPPPPSSSLQNEPQKLPRQGKLICRIAIHKYTNWIKLFTKIFSRKNFFVQSVLYEYQKSICSEKLFLICMISYSDHPSNNFLNFSVNSFEWKP